MSLVAYSHVINERYGCKLKYDLLERGLKIPKSLLDYEKLCTRLKIALKHTIVWKDYENLDCWSMGATHV